jgi:peptidoglycan/LPS O-acetylase OafA/YrhL
MRRVAPAMSGGTAHNNNFNLIRLIAAMQVLAVHSFNHNGFEGPLVDVIKATPGVPTFFFVSGLLIYAAYERTKDVGLMAFINNRAVRIYPALWACVVLSILAVAATGYLTSRQVSVTDTLAWIVGHSTFYQTYNPGFMRDFGIGVFNGALWTIRVELQFYLLAPLLYGMLNRGRSLLFALLLLSLAANLYFRFEPDMRQPFATAIYGSFLPWIYMFLTGFALAHHRQVLVWLQARLRLRWLVPAYTLAMLLLGDYRDNASNAINPVAFLLLCGCILRLATMPLPLPPAVSAFIARHDFSYGLYLYHMPVLNLLLYVGWFSATGNLAAIFLLTALCAALSWFLIERPALQHKR